MATTKRKAARGKAAKAAKKGGRGGKRWAPKRKVAAAKTALRPRRTIAAVEPAASPMIDVIAMNATEEKNTQRGRP